MRIIAGSVRGRKLKSPRGSDIRPTSDKVREALFNILGPAVEGGNFLDLFAGSGGVGLEALSRGARVTLVEKSPAALALLKANLTNCGFENNFQLVLGDALHFVRRLAKSPPIPADDVIVADPPYTSGLADSLLSGLTPGSLSPSGRLIIEHSSRQRPNCSDTPWERERKVIYGKTALSFYRVVRN